MLVTIEDHKMIEDTMVVLVIKMIEVQMVANSKITENMAVSNIKTKWAITKAVEVIMAKEAVTITKTIMEAIIMADIIISITTIRNKKHILTIHRVKERLTPLLEMREIISSTTIVIITSSTITTCLASRIKSRIVSQKAPKQSETCHQQLPLA